MPAAARHFSTSSVMSMISWRRLVLNVRYEVWNFMGDCGSRWTQRIFFLRNHLPGHAVRSPSESSRLPDALVCDPDAVRDAALHRAHSGVGGRLREGAAARECERGVGACGGNGW